MFWKLLKERKVGKYDWIILLETITYNIYHMIFTFSFLNENIYIASNLVRESQ